MDFFFPFVSQSVACGTLSHQWWGERAAEGWGGRSGVADV